MRAAPLRLAIQRESPQYPNELACATACHAALRDGRRSVGQGADDHHDRERRELLEETWQTVAVSRSRSGLVTSNGLERFDVCEILKPAGCTFVRDEIRKADHRHLSFAQASYGAPLPACGKRHAGYRREDVDAIRR